ncbi:MAG: anaerobic ribonucleoside-triphosphate reductase activating protein [Bacteroidales bacterium]|nr:anaerobic ribonucleoside-triphosphate reductase activating protein [Bacteroidales bacterium]
MLRCYSYDIVCQEIPDEITLAVNISCCPNRCPGCHSPWLWEDAGEEMTEEMLVTLIGRYSSAVTCFCFMGGDADPFEVQRFAQCVRKEFPHLRTAWYSGKERIPDGFDISSMDYIKIGPYIAEKGGLKSRETNQVLFRVHPDGRMERIFLK